MKINQIEQIKNQKRIKVKFIAKLKNMKIANADKGNPIGFATFKDATGEIECIFLPDSFMKIKNILKTNRKTTIVGFLDSDSNTNKVYVEKIFL